MRVTKKISPRRLQKKKKKKKKINLIECFKKSLHLKHYSNSTFLLKNKEPYVLLCLKGKKRKLVRINLLIETLLFLYVFFETK